MFLIVRTLQLPTCNVMNVALVQMALFVLCSQQKMIRWLWAMSSWVHATRYLNLRKIGDPSLLLPDFWNGFMHNCCNFMACTMTIKENCNKRPCHFKTATYNIIQDTQGYITSHPKSNTWSLALYIPNEVATMRDRNWSS